MTAQPPIHSAPESPKQHGLTAKEKRRTSRDEWTDARRGPDWAAEMTGSVKREETALVGFGTRLVTASRRRFDTRKIDGAKLSTDTDSTLGQYLAAAADMPGRGRISYSQVAHSDRGPPNVYPKALVWACLVSRPRIRLSRSRSRTP